VYRERERERENVREQVERRKSEMKLIRNDDENRKTHKPVKLFIANSYV
jgi:hypothetical protein